MKILIDVMTLFPKIFESIMNEGIIGRAIKSRLIELTCHQIRDFSCNKHRRIDDYPYGGGKGMIMMAEPIFQTFENIKKIRKTTPYLIYLSPRGNLLNQNNIKMLSTKKNISILCGRYEGVDQRLIDEIVDEEISIGDYVLSGGEIPALVLLDSILRIIPGVLPSSECFENESHYNRLLEYPQYTRPKVWRNKKIPDVLISGNHRKIEMWRKKKSYECTKIMRSDLLT
ncbi:MAG: tRNA (guanosine(37)-N1)-methyltransferase TrmD [Firmicutes bacterium]|nr:tRNA (guanosine(37)-N1)-methyltransferase TrmD [Bacillota bacterium]